MVPEPDAAAPAASLAAPAPAPAPIFPRPWHGTPYAWRFGRHLTRPRLDLLLRARSARVLPPGARARFLAMGLPAEAVGATLAEVRAVAGWPEAWTRTAQRYLGEARREGPAGRPAEAALARRRAALSYHAAHLLAWDDPKAVRALRSSAATLFARTVADLSPGTHRVLVPWRTAALPAYLAYPTDRPGPYPLAVFLNGATTAKEETLLWAGPLLARGLAVLALDQPGTGEAAELAPAAGDHDDIGDSAIRLAADDRLLDPTRVALVGVSLGGALAVRAAAHDRRLAAVVAVTPPYDPPAWLPRANALVLDQLAGLAGDGAEMEALAAGFALPGLTRRVRCPTLVLGAGRDVVVPPAESVDLAAALGDLATLVWYPRGGHALYDALPDWAEDAARWLAALLDAPVAPEASTRVDPSGRAEGGPAPTSGTAPAETATVPATVGASPAPSGQSGRAGDAPAASRAGPDPSDAPA